VLGLHIFLEEFDIVCGEQGFTDFNPFRLKLLELPIDVHDVDSVLEEVRYQVVGSILNGVFSGEIHSVVAVSGPVDVDVEEMVRSLIQSEQMVFEYPFYFTNLECLFYLFFPFLAFLMMLPPQHLDHLLHVNEPRQSDNSCAISPDFVVEMIVNLLLYFHDEVPVQEHDAFLSQHPLLLFMRLFLHI